MSVTTKGGNSIQMTAASDAYTGAVFVAGLTLQVTSGTPGERLLVNDAASGAVIADYMVEAATDNADLWNGREPKYYQGIFISNMPSGTAVLTVLLA